MRYKPPDKSCLKEQGPLERTAAFGGEKRSIGISVLINRDSATSHRICQHHLFLNFVKYRNLGVFYAHLVRFRCILETIGDSAPPLPQNNQPKTGTMILPVAGGYFGRATCSQIDPPPPLNQPHLLNEVAPFRFGSIRRLILPPQTALELMTPGQVRQLTTMLRTLGRRPQRPEASTPETLSSVDRASRRYAKIPVICLTTPLGSTLP